MDPYIVLFVVLVALAIHALISVTIARSYANEAREDLMFDLEGLRQDVQIVYDRQGRLAERVRHDHEYLSVVKQATGGTWKTGNGTWIFIRNMSDAHLRNTRAWLMERPTLTIAQHAQLANIKREQALRRRNKRMTAAYHRGL